MKNFWLSILPGALFSITAPLTIYMGNPDARILNYWGNIFIPIVFALTVFGIVYGLAYLLTRNLPAAGLIGAILVIGIFYLWQIALALVVISLISLLGLVLLRKKIDLVKVNVILIFISAGLILFYGYQMASFLAGLPSTASNALVDPVVTPGDNGSIPAEPPDIYYIILDGYGRADMLNRVYGHDNAGFIDALEGIGFTVPEESRSNYMYTELSLSSSLNMQYLDQMSAILGDTNVWWLARDVIYHSQVRQFLQEKGYRFIDIASGFDYTDIRDADEYIKPFPLMLTNFEGDFLRFSNFASLGDMGHLISYPSYSTFRRIIVSAFEALPRAASEVGPKFVFAHIIAPHPPFVFDENGNPINPNYPFTLSDKMKQIMDVPTYKQSYSAEMQYINSETLRAVRSILANSSRPPVIIIQGDHGPWLYLTDTEASTCLYERFSILNAYYLPGMPAEAIPSTISPVNTFRMIFNQYFSTHLEMLPDRNFYSNYSQYFRFKDVSGNISNRCDSRP